MGQWAQLGKAGFDMDIAANAAKQDKVEGQILGLQYDRQADNAKIEAQQMAKAERKKARLVHSRALAVAGASGAGVTDPQITDILSQVDSEGEINALNTLFTGDNRAQGLRYQGQVARRLGASKAAAGYAAATASAFNSFTDFANNNPTFFSKYGGKLAGIFRGGGGGGAISNGNAFADYGDE